MPMDATQLADAMKDEMKDRDIDPVAVDEFGTLFESLAAAIVEHLREKAIIVDESSGADTGEVIR